jgi:uncharacterized protein YjbJ (UPF0337 family)
VVLPTGGSSRRDNDADEPRRHSTTVAVLLQNLRGRWRKLRSELSGHPEGSVTGSLFSGNAIMDENRVAGTAKNIGGKVEEGFGRVTGDTKSQVEGIVNQATGAAQDLYGQAADTARDTALTFDKWLRNQIETQPYTTALVAVGIGWLLGRLHRPL